MKQPFFCSLPRSETFLSKLTLRFGTEYAFHKSYMMWRGCNCRKNVKCQQLQAKKVFILRHHQYSDNLQHQWFSTTENRSHQKKLPKSGIVNLLMK